MRFIVGIEGPVLAGKSTLARNLRRISDAPLYVAPCYVEFARSIDATLPPVVGQDAAEQEIALRAYFELDERRFRTLPSSGIIILDRTLDTLVAHSYGIAQMGGPDVVGVAEELYAAVPVGRLPLSTFYLETSYSTQLERQASRTEMPHALLDEEFNVAFHRYFLRSHDGNPDRLTFLRAETDPQEIAAAALRVLNSCVTMEEL